MENQIEKIENQISESANVSKAKKEKKSKKKEISTDSINFDKVKISLKNLKNSDFTKEGKGTSNKSIYKGYEGLNEDERKKFRSSIRRELNRFVNQILGKDRSETERIDSIKKFLSFYRKNWQINDFKIENFSQKKNESDISDYRKLLDVVKRSLEN